MKAQVGAAAQLGPVREIGEGAAERAARWRHPSALARRWIDAGIGHLVDEESAAWPAMAASLGETRRLLGLSAVPSVGPAEGGGERRLRRPGRSAARWADAATGDPSPTGARSGTDATGGASPRDPGGGPAGR